jgi:hypothetical protein
MLIHKQKYLQFLLAVSQELEQFSSTMFRTNIKPTKLPCCMILVLVIVILQVVTTAVLGQNNNLEPTVRVMIIQPASPDSPAVTKDYKYRSMVTLYIEHDDGTKTKSGWSTRKIHGAAQDKPFEFQPFVNLIPGWSQGVVQMKETERAYLHIPSELGYGPRPMGSPGGAFYIPPNSNLLFDIEILGKVDETEL